MIAVIFEFTPVEGRFADYQALAAGLAEDVRNADGFLSIERFESLTTRGKFVSLSFWRDEASVARPRHRTGASPYSAHPGNASGGRRRTTSR